MKEQSTSLPHRSRGSLRPPPGLKYRILKARPELGLRRAKIAYLADAGNHRIARVDLSGRVAVVSTFAGTPGVSGFKDGKKGEARFNGPMSIAMTKDGVLFVADTRNHAIRRVTPDGVVTTLIGGAGAALPAENKSDLLAMNDQDPSFWPQVEAPFNQTVVLEPLHLRVTSGQDLVVGEGWSKTLVRLDLGTGRVHKLLRIPRAYDVRRFDIDIRGHDGPVDGIVLAKSGASENDDLFWYPLEDNMDASKEVLMVSQRWVGHSVTNTYPHSVAIHDTEGRMLISSHNRGPMAIRRVRPSDPAPPRPEGGTEGDTPYARGRQVFADGPSGLPWGSRPALAALFGWNGAHDLGGVLPRFEDLVALTDVELAAYIQGGMGGSTARPEISGQDLAGLIYFLRYSALAGRGAPPSAKTIEQNLEGASLYWPNDRRAPEVRSIQVTRIEDTKVEITWRTDEPSISGVRYGPTNYYGMHSALGLQYAKEHTAIIDELVQGVSYHFAIFAKDQQGNFVRTRDQRF